MMGDESYASSECVGRYHGDPGEVNPFIHRIHLTTYDKIKVGVLTVSVLPIRVLMCIVIKLVAWILAVVGLLGLSQQNLHGHPLSGWRRMMRSVICFVLRGLCMASSFHWVTVKGKRATAREAPILALAPHSSYFDAVPVIFLAAPSVVAKGDTENIPVWGTLINYTQPVYVWRDDPNSRENTIKEIKRRTTSEEDWQQILIFPEGTCTNRSCLITFKPGAFLPGVPVQPVCIKYPNRLNTVTWTWDGPGVLKVLWLTLTQFNTNCEIEFLPVYNPSEEEKRDARLYAQNVRNVMANALGVPVTDFTYDDCKLITHAESQALPYQCGVEKFESLWKAVGFTRSPAELLKQHVADMPQRIQPIKLKEFGERLRVPHTNPSIGQLFKLFARHEDGKSAKIDLREYLLGLHILHDPDNVNERLQLAFKLYDRNKKGYLTQSEFATAVVHSTNMPPKMALKVFRHIFTTSTEQVTLDKLYEEAECNEQLKSYLSSHHRVMPLTTTSTLRLTHHLSDTFDHFKLSLFGAKEKPE